MGKYDTLVSHLRECAKIDKSENTFAEAANAIEELESRFERKQGKWEKVYYGNRPNRCSEFRKKSNYRTNFCPNCGADMRGET